MKKNKVFKIIGIILRNLPFLVVIFFSFFIVFSSYYLPGGLKLFSVLSGSMEPAIKTGSVIIVKKQGIYNDKDIITFTVETEKNKVTHRIIKTVVDNKVKTYITKGDANKIKDVRPVLQNNIQGKVIFTIPYLGYIFGFSRTTTGLIIIIALATIIVYTELITIKNQILFLFKNRTKAKNEKNI